MDNITVIVISIVCLVGAYVLSPVMPLLMGVVLGLAMMALVLSLNLMRYSSLTSILFYMLQGLLPLSSIYIAFFVLYFGLSYFKKIKSQEQDLIDGYMDMSNNSVLQNLSIIKAEWIHSTYIYIVGLVLLLVLVFVNAPASFVASATVYTPLLMWLSLPFSLLVWFLYYRECVDKKHKLTWLVVTFMVATILITVSTALEGTSLSSLAVLGPLVLLGQTKCDEKQLKKFVSVKTKDIVACGYVSSLPFITNFLVVLSNLFAFTSQSAILAIDSKGLGNDAYQAKINSGFVGAMNDVACLFILVLLGLVRGDMDLAGRLQFLPTFAEWITILGVALAVVLIIGASFEKCFDIYKALHKAEGLSVAKMEKIQKVILLAVSAMIIVMTINSWFIISLLVINYLVIFTFIKQTPAVGSGTTAAIPLFILMNYLPM